MTQTTPETVTDQRIDATYREALDLAVQARAYIAERADTRRGLQTAGEADAVYAAETMRMSTRIMHVVAWVMNRKAVYAGEIDRAAALAPDRRLGGESVCRAAPVGDLRLLPAPVQEMIALSCDLYERAARLERLLDDAGAEDSEAAASEPVIHKLWREIEDLDGES